MLHWLRQPAKMSANSPRRRGRFVRPWIEILEERTLLATFMVANTNDSGPGSLRQAILDANVAQDTDTINFNIGGGGAQTISPATPLPAISGPTLLDATTQPGFAGLPLVELNGANAGAGADGLNVTGRGITIRGFTINRFDGDGIELGGTGANFVQGNFIGINAAGTAALPNNGEGINILAASLANTVGGTVAGQGNVISGNLRRGINLASTNNQVQGNFIGTNTGGASRLPNTLGGLLISGSTNQIGGTTPAARNVISGNDGPGVTITLNASGVDVQGNYIGTDATGSVALANSMFGVTVSGGSNRIGSILAGARNVISGNAGPGVAVFGSGILVLANYIGINAAGTAALANTVGVVVGGGALNANIGGATASRNIISGNTGHGVDVQDNNDLTFVQGNFIGLNPAGTSAIPNGQNGVNVTGASTLVGGLQPGGLGNVISGNLGHGISFTANDAFGNRAIGNRIGTDASGTAPLGNGGDGIVVNGSGTLGMMIGTTQASEGNTIAFNAGTGVLINGGIMASIRGNAIHSNGGLGIDLAPLGVTLNDPNDADTGPNNLQNFPVLTSALLISSGVKVTGVLNSIPARTYFLDFYSSPTGDPSGNGEGAVYLGSQNVTTNSLGVAPFSITFSTAVPLGHVITATATGNGSDSSEFSRGTGVVAVMQVADINPRTADAAPSALVDVNGVLFFAADDGLIGRELYKSNGSLAGTVLVRNIGGDDPAVFGSTPRNLVNNGGTLFFFADDEFSGAELWRSDGTEGGTQPVTSFVDNPSQLLSAGGGLLYFVDNGNELWQSNGTPAGTVQITTLSGIAELRLAAGKLYFRATGGSGTELYEYDGSTVRLIDINPGAASSTPINLTAVGGSLYFTATSAAGGTELYLLNGPTPTLIDIVVGAGSSSPTGLVNVNDILYFAATAGAGTELYSHDGSVLTPFDLVSGPGSSSPGNLTNVNGTLYFRITTPASGTEVARFEGSTATVIDIVSGTGSSNPAILTALGSTLYLRASNAANGTELFRVDGTAFMLVADILPGSGSANPANLTPSGSRLFFTAVDSTDGVEVWVTNGTTAGTQQTRDINLTGPGSNPASLTPVNDILFFSADDGTNGRELWRTDGTTTTLIDVATGAASSNPANLVNVNGTLFFSATTVANGTELYRLTGATPTLIDIVSGPGSSSPANLTNVNGTLYFTATTSANGTELYRLSGTSPILIDIDVGMGSSNPANLTAVGNVVYFTATTPANGTELYRYDGSSFTLIDIAGGAASSNPANLVNVNGTLFFTANTAATGTELYTHDGATLTPLELVAGAGSANPGNLTAAGSGLFFTAINGASGVELWRSNGTQAGTVPVTSTLINPASLLSAGGTLFFVDNGKTLYRSDGTGPGTVVVRDFFFSVSNVADVNGTLFFSANDGTESGTELWRSDGTAAGTHELMDIFPGRDLTGEYRSSSPGNLTNVNGTLFFTATDQRGVELWKVVPSVGSAPSVVQFNVSALSVNENGGQATVTVTRGGSTTGVSTVLVVTSNGTATAGSDYTAVSQTVTFAAGQTSQTVVVPITEDTLHEGNETLSLTLSNPTGASLGSPTFVVLTINDNDRLVVTSVTATATGFVAQFNGPFDGTLINLYDSLGGSLGPTDVTLVGATNGAVAGSVVIDAVNQRLTFLRTGGVLPVDNYTATLRSAANGFRSTVTGELLDGNNDGIAGGDAVNAFAGGSSAIAVSIPDFMRGPGQAVVVPATGTGLPLQLSASAGVTSVEVTVRFNPNLLTITAATVAQGLPGGATVSLNTSTPGTAIVTFNTPALGMGITDFVILTANVPSSAGTLYTLKQILDLTNLSINGGALAGVDDDGLHVNAYLGDATANARYSSADAVAVLNVAVGRASGFAAYQQADPVIIADVTSNGLVNSTDATRILQEAVGIDAAQIPDLPPSPPTIAISGPDPLLSLPKRLQGKPGSVLTVPVSLDQSDGLQSADLALSFDPRQLEVIEVQRGDLTSDFDLFAVNLDAETGTIRVALGRTIGPPEEQGPGDVLRITFRIKPDASAGRAIVNLRERVGMTTTQLNEGGLDLNPDPSDEAGDVLDGVITIGAGRSQRLLARDVIFAAERGRGRTSISEAMDRILLAQSFARRNRKSG